MKSSRIKFIRPELLNNELVSSWFSLRNQDSVNTTREIAGLNLGLNTDEEDQIVLKNRKILFDEIGLDPQKLAIAVQIHKTNVEYVTHGGIYADTDAFVTDKQGLALAIQVADCAAILLADTENKVIGAAHAGWRGAVSNIISKTVHKMKDQGAKVEHINTFVSPCISLENFEVGEEVACQFPDEFVEWERFKKPHVDLNGLLRYQLLNEGILEQHIEMDAMCTISNPDFYSYRRQKNKSGRMMGIIKLN